MLYWEIIAVCSETRTKELQILYLYLHKVPLLQYGLDDRFFFSVALVYVEVNVNVSIV